MRKTRKGRRLADAYRYPGFRPLESEQGLFGDPQARLITLVRQGKKRSAGPAARCIRAGTTAGADGHGTFFVGTTAFTWIWRCGAFSVVGAVP